MADLDLGTEHLRWMGDGRFILGYLQGGTFNSQLFGRDIDWNNSRFKEDMPHRGRI